MTKDSLLDDLNQAQREAVTHGEGPLLIVAGAGTGKTTVITRRIAWLIREGRAKGNEILALTFTDKAAGEMEERVDRLLPMGYLDLWISTFHLFGERLLKAHAIDIGLPNNFKLLDQTGQWLLVRRNFSRFDLDYYRPLGNPTKFIHALLKHFSRAKDEGIGPEEYLDYVEGLKLNTGAGESAGGEVISKKVKSQKSKVKSMESLLDDSSIIEGEVGRLEEIAKAYHVYQQLLLENNALDFGDLITYTLKLLRARPKILAQYRNQFKYILVDEFQDTNWAQYELVKLIASHSLTPDDFSSAAIKQTDALPSEKSLGFASANLTVVADDDQSIYRFRGAAMSNILQFEKDYPEADFVVLTENYRSCQEILDLSYQFIQKNNPNRLEARSGTDERKNERTKEREIVKKLRAVQTGKATIEYLHLKTAEDEINSVINKIVQIKKYENASLSWNDFAILVRANSQADAFVQALSQAGIPTQYIASRGLYSKPIILDIVSWLKLLDNYHESPALWRILSSAPAGLPWKDLTELAAFATQKSMSLYEALRRARTIKGVSDAGHKVIDRMLSLIERETQAARKLSVGKVILQWLEESGYLKYLSKLPEQEAKEQFSYLNQFYKVVSQFEQSLPDPSVRNFLEAHSMELESGDVGGLEVNLEEGPETVKVMTVHAAKGLEFHTVFVVQLVDKRFPSIERSDPIELPQALVKEFVPEGDIHLEEERRLFYVAMTRAKKSLFLTSAEDYGGARKKRPSIFLFELGLIKEGKEAKEGEGGEARAGLAIGLYHRSIRSDKSDRLDRTYKLPERFSFTQLKAFETCPYQYRFAHILKVPVKGRATFSFGKTMHTTLQQFFELMKAGGGKQQGLFQKETAPSVAGASDRASLLRRGQSVPPLETLLDLYEKNWIDDWYDSKQHMEDYKAKGKKILQEFYEKVKENPPKPIYLEQGFHLKLWVDRGNKGNREDESRAVAIKGVIDRIDEVEGGVEIVDYKTGRAKDLDTADKDQLLIYQIAAEEVLGLKPLRLTYYYLDEQKPVSFIGTKEQVEKIKEKIVETVAAIKTSDFKATPSPQVCRSCDFREICEFRQL